MSNSFILFMAICNSLCGVLLVFLTKPLMIKKIFGVINVKNNLIWIEDLILNSYKLLLPTIFFTFEVDSKDSPYSSSNLISDLIL